MDINARTRTTAILVSLLKLRRDPFHRYFMTRKVKKIFYLLNQVFSEKKIERFFSWRIRLTEIFDCKISSGRTSQILELGAGYSMRGFRKCLKNPNIIYVESDLRQIVRRKRKVLQKICRKERMRMPSNYHLLELDAVNEDIFEKVKTIFPRGKKILILAEGLTLYFSEPDFEIFLGNIKRFFDRYPLAEFYSHEWIKKPKNIFFRLLGQAFLLIVAGRDVRKCYKTKDEFKLKLERIGFKKIKFYRYRPGFLFYSIFNFQ